MAIGGLPCFRLESLHTSKRMHFIEDAAGVSARGCRFRLHTSKRMHFIEEGANRSEYGQVGGLAYVKTYALH